MKILHTVAATAASCALALLSSDVAGAQVDDYPNRTARLIVPFPPGGGADLTQRFREMGWEALASTPAECLAFLQSERVKWGRVVKERGMRAD